MEMIKYGKNRDKFLDKQLKCNKKMKELYEIVNERVQ